MEAITARVRGAIASSHGLGAGAHLVRVSRDEHCTVASWSGKRGVSTQDCAGKGGTQRARTVHVQLAGQQRQRVQVAPGHHLVAVAQPEAELANGQHLVKRARGGQQASGVCCPARCTPPLATGGGPPRLGVRVWLLVEFAAGDVQVVADGFQVVLHLLRSGVGLLVPGSGRPARSTATGAP